VTVVESASERATDLEVRAHDSPGLLHRVSTALAAQAVDVVAARVATLGSDVVDVFYLVDREGAPLSPQTAQAVRHEVLAVLTGPRER
jgi:[protein-PII] uridylyltransferase